MLYTGLLGVTLVLLVWYAFYIDRARTQPFTREGFVDPLPAPKKQLFTTNLGNTKALLPSTPSTPEEVSIDIMQSLVSVIESGKKIPDNWQGTTVCVDPVDLEKLKKNNTGTHKRLDREGYFACLIHPDRKMELPEPYNIANRRVGVFDICDMHLVRAIAYGYRMPNGPPVVNVSYVPRNRWKYLEKELKTNYDVMIVYMIKGSTFEQTIYSQRVEVLGFETLNIERVNVTYPDVYIKKTYMSDVYKWTSKVPPKVVYDRDAVVNLLWCPMHLFTISDPKGARSGPIQEPFITSLRMSEEISDPAYRCYGDLRNENRALCNSTYDAWGKPKEQQTYWDVPCVEDTDCPFYKANKNYPNTFGKCTSEGTCEFPVGIKRLAYTLYTDQPPFTPMCYGCDPADTDCCKTQTNNPQNYPALTTPDYAFANDRAQREPRAMQIAIPLPE